MIAPEEEEEEEEEVEDDDKSQVEKSAIFAYNYNHSASIYPIR